MDPISQASTLAQYSAGMGLVYQLFGPAIQKNQDNILNELFNRSRSSKLIAVLGLVNNRVGKVRQVAGVASYVSMLFSLAVLMLFTANPNRCAFIFNQICVWTITEQRSIFAWSVMIFLISGPLTIALACFGIQTLLSHLIIILLERQ
jgi:hypothetical protein